MRKEGQIREAEAGIESHHCLLSICVHTSPPELEVMPSGDLNLLVDDLPVMIRVLDDGVMEKEENVTLTLTEVNFNQEQGKYFINTLNIIIAADECESSRAYI